nr:glycosyltransferase family 9 protein [Amycolatopsis rubida]
MLAGPAVRAIAAQAEHVTLLAGPYGAAAGELLPGVDEVQVFRAPWIDPEPPPLTRSSVDVLAEQLTGFEAAFVLTSFHQSPLPLALVLRLAGVPWIGAICDDYPGSLLNLRHRVPGDPPEALRMLSLAQAAGCALPPGDDGRLAIRGPLPDVSALTGIGDYVVVHPTASVPARSPSPVHSGRIVDALVQAGHRVVVTGAKPEGTTAGVDLSGGTSLLELAAVLAGAEAVVAPNTGPAHLAAAVGTPVVSLFAPVVPAARWAPFGVPAALLGDQHAPCRGSRVRTCPVPGHPCLDGIDPAEVVAAVAELVKRPSRRATA